MYGHSFVSRATQHKRFILRACEVHHNYLSYYILTVFDTQTCKRDDTLLRPSGIYNIFITMLFVPPFHLFMMQPQQTCISVNDEKRHNRSRLSSPYMTDLIADLDEASQSTTIDVELHLNSISEHRQSAQTLLYQWFSLFILSSSQLLQNRFQFDSKHQLKHTTYLHIQPKTDIIY